MATKREFHITASLSLAGALLLWSTVPLFLRSFIDEIDGWTANGFRYPFGSIIWFVPLVFLIVRNRIDTRLFRLALIPACVNIFAQVFWALTPYYLTPGLQIFFGQSSVIFSILFSFAVFPDELQLIHSKYFWGGIALCLLGFVGMNVLQGNFQGEITVVGIIFILLHGLFMGLYGVSVRYYLRGVKPWLSFAVICTYTSIGLFILMLLLGEPSRLFEMEPSRFVLLCVSALVGISFAHILFYHSIIHLGVSISSGCRLLMPFLTASGSYFIFREIFSVGQWLSGLLIIAGAGLLMVSQRHLGKLKQK
ncbi:EamA family transporter [bacterium]|nr:EamA family transporter [bacterium]